MEKNVFSFKHNLLDSMKITLWRHGTLGVVARTIKNLLTIRDVTTGAKGCHSEWDVWYVTWNFFYRTKINTPCLVDCGRALDSFCVTLNVDRPVFAYFKYGLREIEISNFLKKAWNKSRSYQIIHSSWSLQRSNASLYQFEKSDRIEVALFCHFLCAGRDTLCSFRFPKTAALQLTIGWRIKVYVIQSLLRDVTHSTFMEHREVTFWPIRFDSGARDSRVRSSNASRLFPWWWGKWDGYAPVA